MQPTTTTPTLDKAMYGLHRITMATAVIGGLPFTLLEMDLAAAIGEQLAISIIPVDVTLDFGWCN